MDRRYIPLLRIESLAALLALLALYQQAGHDWRSFAYWILAPDLAILAYLFGPRIGAYAYNATHSYIGPALLALAAPVLAGVWPPASPPPMQLALIWLAHIAADRALGFGLKSTESFYVTHLGEMKLGFGLGRRSAGPISEQS